MLHGISALFRPLEQCLSRAGLQVAVHFLETDDIGIQFLDHSKASRNVLSPVPTDAPVNIIGGDP